MSLDMKDVKQPNVPAYYTSFNFNKLIRQKEKKQAKTEKGE